MKVRIIQVYRVERWIDVDVNASTIEEALDLAVDCDIPPLSDEGWNYHWELQNEEHSAFEAQTEMLHSRYIAKNLISA